MRREPGTREQNALKNKDGGSQSGYSRRSARATRCANDPSLEDDVDNEVLENAIFREAKPFEVKEVSSVHIIEL